MAEGDWIVKIRILIYFLADFTAQRPVSTGKEKGTKHTNKVQKMLFLSSE
jgi:hypothetical protein